MSPYFSAFHRARFAASDGLMALANFLALGAR
jgi:hypothetical protein